MPDYLQSDRAIRVFVSSTPGDMKAERDLLVTSVFPELRARIKQLGFQFFDIDVRWAAPRSDSGAEPRDSWEYSRQWIDRVTPFFVCLLGQNYGQIPAASQIDNEADRNRYAGLSVTEMEVRYAIFDAAAHPKSFFYFRETPVPKSASPDVYGVYVDAVHAAQLEALKERIRTTSSRPVRGYDCRWSTKGFTDFDTAASSLAALVLEDLWSGVLRDERYVPKDIWLRVLDRDPDTSPLYTDESHPVPQELWERIVAAVRQEPVDPLDLQQELSDAFAADKLRWFSGRSAELKQLVEFVSPSSEDAPRLAVVTGPPGQGKSTLLAKLGDLLKSSPYYVFTHFADACELAPNGRTLAARLLGELERSGVEWDEPGARIDSTSDYNSLCRRVAQKLAAHAGDRRIVIIVDSVDELLDGHDLEWLPDRLGPSVSVVLSFEDDPGSKDSGPQQAIRHAIAARQGPPLAVLLGELQTDDIRAIVNKFLLEYCLDLDITHVKAIGALPQARNPLFLLILLSELQLLRGADVNVSAPSLIASMAADHPNAVSLFRAVLKRLEVFSADAARWWCVYLACGRAGMSSRELADLVTAKLGPESASAAYLIERRLRRYMIRRGAQLDFMSDRLREAVPAEYGESIDLIEAHSNIASYFRATADPDGVHRWQISTRLLGELQYHLARAERIDELSDLLSELAFVAARVSTGRIYEQIHDYALAGNPMPAKLTPWLDFLELHADKLARLPTTLVALVNHEGFGEARAEISTRVWAGPWLRTSPEPMPAATGIESDELTVEITGSITFPWARISAIAPRESLVFTLDRLGLVRIFDLATMSETDAALTIRRERPLAMACSPDASSLIVLYETGKAELYRCLSGSSEWPDGLDPVAEFDYLLPETEDPVVVWNKGAYWYQMSPGSLASITLENPHPIAEPLPVGYQGELASLVFSAASRLAILRQSVDSVLLIPGAPPLRRQSAHVASAVACGDTDAAVAFTDGVTVFYEVGDVLTVKAEVRAGIPRGALGWTGSWLLWMSHTGDLCAWRPAKGGDAVVQEKEGLFPEHLHVLPRQWLMLPGGFALLCTSHSVVAFSTTRAGSGRDSRIVALFGGSTWRSVRHQQTEMWLMEKGRANEVLLSRSVTGRLYCAPDGKGHFFAATSSGTGLVLDLTKIAAIALIGCPSGINAAAGDDAGGCWFTDGAGDLHYAAPTGQCSSSARVSVRDVHGSQLENCGDHLVWLGYSSKYFQETGSEPARTFVFFKKEPGMLSKVERLGEQVRNPNEGVCQAVQYDRTAKRLVTLWTKEVEGRQTHLLRIGPVREFSKWQYKEIEVAGMGQFSVAHAGLSANGRFLGVIDNAGELACVSVADGRVVTRLAVSAPFTAIAPGAAGPEFWLVEAREKIYRCALAEGSL